MTNTIDTSSHEDPYDLSRFILAQENIYDQALAELKSGHKRSHWMWYIFPQIAGLGESTFSKHYAIKSVEEARHYLIHPILGTRLLECTTAVLAVEGRSAAEIFGYLDDLKFKSSMTLFGSVAGPRSVFVRIRAKYFDGDYDVKTVQLLEKLRILYPPSATR